MGRGGRRRPTGRSLFLGVLLVVVAGYTQMAFELEWRTAAGRIGPGFFPRVIGIAALVILLWALVTSLRPGAVDGEDDAGGTGAAGDEEAGDADLGRHPVPLLLVLATAVVFLLVFFIPLGMVVSCALFLLVTLFLLNRRHPVTNVVVALAVPLLVYLLFQSVLNAGLPAGLLPRF
ncbi:Tripartite tricarboxylate transporter TctB family protein [Geodermatophilus pulveris]|uniref:Tripartite tricarboxylate transporter TctB family protein n=1 Tax=Geodermatophilus pulveris TaxID=1564159 RepID=A0A239HA38_9ACTN|nr:Tripartite tricarboxylate transporter TctB family protein [Geodermatophilus pulveris]